VFLLGVVLCRKRLPSGHWKESGRAHKIAAVMLQNILLQHPNVNNCTFYGTARLTSAIDKPMPMWLIFLTRSSLRSQRMILLRNLYNKIIIVVHSYRTTPSLSNLDETEMRFLIRGFNVAAHWLGDKTLAIENVLRSILFN
jgi:hypothetical protein